MLGGTGLLGLPYPERYGGGGQPYEVYLQVLEELAYRWLAVAEAANFYKIDLSHIVVFHDEIDLAPAKVRVKTGGGIAGHNGLRSISAHVGYDYVRVRIGIGHPGAKELVDSYVLGDFAVAERPWVEALCGILADNAAMLVRGQDAGFQNKVHLAMQAKGFDDVPQVGRPKKE